MPLNRFDLKVIADLMTEIDTNPEPEDKLTKSEGVALKKVKAMLREWERKK